ncbi:sugar phosphate isomerase/epimerase [Rhizobium leguminosarum]|uniref:sugar phosphate isomerase/epimerase n=1 Tax=Rhizobium leguminosarum TaxID=384 RepID=UPI0024B328EC|nr:sugar phosphate isomerase/epimerase [Rhizobium leguminosarum]WHO82625.1 sugar phosphate isomerase/epimerase [Rhizobium leguminosarum]
MQHLKILQSMWAMERRHTDGIERSVEQNVEMIMAAGFDGLSARCTDAEILRRISEAARPQGLIIQGSCYPQTVDELKPVLELATKYGVDHINLQPNVRPRRLQDCIPILEGWRRLMEQVDFPVYIETHRDRMTTDLYFTLDLLDCFPDLKLLGDISHYLVGREFAVPVSDENHRMIEQILDHCWAFHGRVASREQVQIEISFPHHKIWVDLFMGWWEYGFRSWRKRSQPGAVLCYTCELGPQPYSITGPDGNDTTDRWKESLLLKGMIGELWAKTAQTAD